MFLLILIAMMSNEEKQLGEISNKMLPDAALDDKSKKKMSADEIVEDVVSAAIEETEAEVVVVTKSASEGLTRTIKLKNVTNVE